MPITYTNTKAQTYCLHRGRTKTGKPKYYFSLQREGSLAESIPEGFEIYETPNAQVFLRRIPPRLITEAERQSVADGMRTYGRVRDYKIEVKGKAIVIYLADQDRKTLAGIVRDYTCSPEEQTRMLKVLQQTLHYSPMLQFLLVDAQRRVFAAQRYCFRGAIDDWIYIGMPATLSKLVRTYVQHLGRESYFDLW